jgi:predicted Fe-S protein YdhL (DUF1289 family)
MAGIHLIDIEAAINWWRTSAAGLAAGPGAALPAPLAALAEVYARMVYDHADQCDEDRLPAAARDAWLAWYATTPDAPCIAICSTTQGDAVCKGCGRSFDEVQHWPQLSPAQKRAVWHRITAEGSAWRFNRYAERARLAGPAA